MAGMALDPVPAYLVAADRGIKPLPEICVLDGFTFVQNLLIY